MTDPEPVEAVYTRTEESIESQFPDRGEAPSNEIVVDPEAEPVPNVEHPE
jgi:hypothetical protein